MKIRMRFTLFTMALIGAVVGLITLNIARTQRRIIESESAARLETLMEGVARLARESIESRDELMLLSYLLFLQKEHPEFRWAAVTSRGHTATVGEEVPGLTYLGRALPPPEGAAAEPSLVRLGFAAEGLKSEIERAWRPLLRRTLAIAGLFMLLGWLAAYLIARRLTASLAALAEAAEEVGRGNLEVTVPMDGQDEVGALGQRFNSMTASLRELVGMREEILHTLTHELNTPLAGLKGYLELWQEGGVPEGSEKKREALEALTGAVARMEHSLGDALRFFAARSRREAGGYPRVVWLNEVLHEVLSLFGPVAQAKRLTLQGLPDGLKGHVVAEPELVRRIVTNLVSNAVKYTPEGGEVRVDLVNAPENLLVSVADTGPGLSPENLARLFTKFERPGEGERPGGSIPGTGLGLSIAKQAAERLGGRLWGQSQVGKGSVFYVLIPKTPQAPLKEAV